MAVCCPFFYWKNSPWFWGINWYKKSAKLILPKLILVGFQLIIKTIGNIVSLLLSWKLGNVD